MPGQGKGSELVSERGEEWWVREFSEEKPGKGVIFEM